MRAGREKVVNNEQRTEIPPIVPSGRDHIYKTLIIEITKYSEHLCVCSAIRKIKDSWKNLDWQGISPRCFATSFDLYLFNERTCSHSINERCLSTKGERDIFISLGVLLKPRI